MTSIEAQVAIIDQKLEDHIIESKSKYKIFDNTTKDMNEMVIHMKWIKWIGFVLLGLSSPNAIPIIKFISSKI